MTFGFDCLDSDCRCIRLVVTCSGSEPGSDSHCPGQWTQEADEVEASPAKFEDCFWGLPSSVTTPVRENELIFVCLYGE